MIKHVYSGTTFEQQMAYARAKRVGPYIAVSGTAAFDGGEIVGRGDAYEQARFIFQKVGKALAEAGASLGDVIRTRIYLIDMKHFDDVARAHKEVFAGIDPAATAIEVAGFVDETMLVEIEVDAFIDS